MSLGRPKAIDGMVCFDFRVLFAAGKSLTLPKRNTVNNVRNVLTFKHLNKRELEGWREQRRSYPAGRGWRIT
jgi:hypothetical protein